MSTFTSKLSPGDVFHDRMIRVIKCPSDCTEVTAILLQDATGDLIGEFTLCDANGDTTAGIGNVWAAGHYIQVLFDKTSGCAQVLNGANSRAVQNRLKTAVVTLTSAGWDNKTQTVAVSGVPADGDDNAVFPSPAPDYQTAYADAGIKCTVHSEGELTFTCEVVPAADIQVNVVIFDNAPSALSGGGAPGGTGMGAASIPYDNTVSGLGATNVQAAVDELAEKAENIDGMGTSAVMSRRSLTAADDMNAIIQAGYYFKDSGISVANGVNSRRARIVCLQLGTSTWGLSQLWHDTTSNKVYIRSKNSPSVGWSGWERFITDTEDSTAFSNIIPVTDNLPNTAEQVYALWDGLLDGNRVTKTTLGNVDGYDYPMYHVDFAPESMTANYRTADADSLFTRKRVLIVASIHGDEPVPVIATYEFFKYALSSSGFENIKGYVFDIVPVGNPWGFSHSVVNSAGEAKSGFSNYVATNLLDGYTVRAHTADWRGYGIRYNALGYDINRDFSNTEYSQTYSKDAYYVGDSDVNITYGFKTSEATLLGNLITNGYDFVIDFHMGGGTGDVTPTSDICGFTNLNAKPANMTDSEYANLQNLVLSTVQKCHVKLDADLNQKYNVITGTQGFYVWGALGSSVGDIPNWFAGTPVNTEQRDRLAKFALTIEVSLWCHKYSQSTIRCNAATNEVALNYFGRMLNEICDINFGGDA